MKKRIGIIGTSILTLALLSACTSEDTKNTKPTKDKDTATEDVTSSVGQGAVPEITSDTVKLKGHENLTEAQKQAAENAFKVLKRNLESTNNENIEGYLTTVKTQDEELTRTTQQGMFDKLNIYNRFASDVEVIFVADDLSKIELRVTQDAISTELTEDFQNQRLTALHVVELVEGEYKITATKVEPSSIFLLDDKGQLAEGIATDKVTEEKDGSK